MTQPRHHSRHHGADRAPASDVDDIIGLGASISSFEEWALTQATADRVRQHPSGKSTRAHNVSSVKRDQHHADGASKTCPKKALTE